IDLRHKVSTLQNNTKGLGASWAHAATSYTAGTPVRSGRVCLTSPSNRRSCHPIAYRFAPARPPVTFGRCGTERTTYADRRKVCQKLRSRTAWKNACLISNRPTRPGTAEVTCVSQKQRGRDRRREHPRRAPERNNHYNHIVKDNRAHPSAIKCRPGLVA